MRRKEKKTLLQRYKDFRLPLLLELMKWKFIDLYRGIKHPSGLHVYGIWCFVGIYGGGKTISLVDYLERMRRKHGDKIRIATNFYYSGQDFAITKWEDLLPEYDTPVIFAYDELQNEFNSREYRSFPVSLMTLLTQNRKGKGKQIVYTTQVYDTVDTNFRKLTSQVVTCRTILKRLTHTRTYPREQYDQLFSQTSIDRKLKIHPISQHWFVQTDELRGKYDSFQMLETAKSKQYMGLSGASQGESGTA